MTLQEIMQEVHTLTLEERKQLIKMLVDTFTETIESQPTLKKHSILDFKGVGAEMWNGIDAQEYVNQLRSEWDRQP